ncbi:hypothetical protein L1987_20404 [Smallanthus sonchifolius]|uniref:Uncharacterized protein n=1 Tax=Smallanthus sonchifolius TaxID=185202 RepID=A0ACB9ISH2_9ASTR|nr:hypothetical protein L1987_20404 [Smallanthus sonchifolius]
MKLGLGVCRNDDDSLEVTYEGNGDVGGVVNDKLAVESENAGTEKANKERRERREYKDKKGSQYSIIQKHTPLSLSLVKSSKTSQSFYKDNGVSLGEIQEKQNKLRERGCIKARRES